MRGPAGFLNLNTLSGENLLARPAAMLGAAPAAPAQEELLARANRGTECPFDLPRTFEGRPLAEDSGCPNPGVFFAGPVFIVVARFDDDTAAFRVGASEDPGASGWEAEVPGARLGLSHLKLIEALRNEDARYGASLVADCARFHARAPGGFTLFVGERLDGPGAHQKFARVDACVELASAPPERLAVSAWLLAERRRDSLLQRLRAEPPAAAPPR